MKETLKTLVLSLIFSSISIVTMGQCSMKGEYDQMFDIEVYESEELERKLLIKRIAKVDESKCYAKAINQMPDFFDYIKTHFASKTAYGNIDLNVDSVKLREEFKEVVNADDIFTGKMEEYFLRTNGTIKKEQIVFEELVDVAVKFFNVKGITDKGSYMVKVCSGINLVESTLPQRRPFLEAFAFSALLNDIKNMSPNMMDEFQQEMKTLYDLNLGNNKDERLLRAQGAAFMLMKKNNRLNAVLATYYAENRDILPFELIANQ